jgi:hypothetical protein
VHERLFSEGARAHRLGHVDFALRRGVRVPRTVEFFDLPENIVTLVPAYRHYKYFLVGDEIVIVDPVNPRNRGHHPGVTAGRREPCARPPSGGQVFICFPRAHRSTQ